MGVFRMYLIAKPVGFTDTKASILMNSSLQHLECLLEAAKNPLVSVEGEGVPG